MTDLKIGELITIARDRDAIHVAVAPVIAGESLSPGQHVGVQGDGTAGFKGPWIGIVDPFLTSQVQRGEKFWLFLYPGSITSLRHDWTHPAFGAAMQSPSSGDRETIEAFAATESVSYEEMLGLLGEMDASGSVYGASRYSAIPGGVWDAYERITGRHVADRPEYFSCSC